MDKRYQISQPLGAGGSSQVYLAKDTALNRDVAIKVLDPAAAADGNLRRMFVKEARSLAQLSHANIVSVFDVGEVQDQPYIVMEYVPGGSLKARIERTGPLKAGEAARFAIEIANGLAFAHSKGIIHADLKPSNILFDSNDHAKIADFGIARTPREDAATPELFATAMYVAPERVEGKHATVQSDIYGLGLVLYEMLVGKPPFTSTSAAVLMRDHVVRVPVPPSHLRPSLPRELDTIVLKALAKQPNLRYQKASEFANAVAAIENVDKELATTRVVPVMTEPINDFVPGVDQSPVVALLSGYGQPLRRAFFALLAALPVFALMILASFGLFTSLAAAGLVGVVAIAGQLGAALAIAWVIETLLIFLFVPVLAVLFALMGVWVWLRDVRTEQAIMAMAMPVTAPLGLAPAFVLTAAAIDGLMGVITAAWGGILTVVFAVASGAQTIGPFTVTGFTLRQETLFDPLRAIETKSAIIGVLQGRSAAFGEVMMPETIVAQAAALVSRVVGADVAALATVIAWTIAALTVWSVTRLLRSFFDTLLRRPQRWFSLFLFAQAVGVVSGAVILFLLFITWGPLDNAAGRPADGVLFVAAMVGVAFATALGVVIGATQRPEPEEEQAPAMAARRLPVR
ncbi:MAG TPA: serine/threonine-protein kinase [Candidatus Limnocylindria bacterium]|nr:serine/threonine-protein kinase [Candidatus Limnocylindria bacterium]